MFKHYLTTALRHFRQHKLTTSINVVCLALGILCFMLVWGTMAYFSKADSYHARADRTYFITNGVSPPNSKSSFVTLITTPWILAETLKADIPQLESVARSIADQALPVTIGDKTHSVPVAFADAQFTRIFDLPFIAGYAATALAAPRSAVVSATFAERVFNTRNVIGRTLRIANKESVTITGVIGSIPQPSLMSTTRSQARLYFEILLSMDTHVALAKSTMSAESVSGHFARWGFNSYLTYIVLPKDGSITESQLRDRLAVFSDTRVPRTDGAHQFGIRSMSRLTEQSLNMIAGTDKTGVSATLLLQVLGGLVLLVACLNYANLATAQAVTRAKEAALQKIMGATASQVMLQYFCEASLLVSTALVLALAGIGLVVLSSGPDVLAALTQLFFRMPQFWACLAILLIIVSAVTGAYPALAVFRVRPVHALRTARLTAGSTFASMLVGLQFASASFLIIAVFVMSSQNDTAKRAVANPATDPVVVIASDTKDAGIDPAVLKTELQSAPGVVAVSGIQYMPWSMTFEMTSVSAEREVANTTPLPVYRNMIDSNFFTTLDIPLLAGRDFEERRHEDLSDLTAQKVEVKSSNALFNVVIDRALARQLGFARPQDAIGKVIYNHTTQDASTPPVSFNVIGVAEDSTLRPMGFTTANVYLFNPAAARVPVVRIAKSSVRDSLASIDRVWSRLAPTAPIVRRFADEQFEQSFGFLRWISGTFTVLAAFSLVIASMGLVGMALHIIQRRMHEIGVRKTLGASVNQILLLLLRSFSKPIVIANVAAWPLVYLAMKGYLSIFASKTTLTLMPFVASLLVTLGIAWLAVAFQATRAARMNPATVLRYE